MTKGQKKKRIKRIRNQEKVFKLRNMLGNVLVNSMEHNIELDWYGVLNKLNTSDLKLISDFDTPEGHIFDLASLKDALCTLLLERLAKLEKEGKHG